jgi:hypothetical protein
MAKSSWGALLEFFSIHTLDARANIFLEVMTDYLGLSEPQVFAQVRGMAVTLQNILAAKGLSYADLKPALVPSSTREERAFVFDGGLSGSMYGKDAIESTLPLLGRESTHSILAGDWIAETTIFQQAILASPSVQASETLLSHRFVGTPFVILLNNLSMAQAEAIRLGLQAKSSSFVGALNLNLASPLKGILAGMLVRDLIKHRSIVLCRHEDDRPDSYDGNITLYDLEGLGFAVRSVPSLLYGVLLSYKVERPPLPNERDRDFLCNAMSPAPVRLVDMDVQVDAAKLAYLRRSKAGSLKAAGLEAAGTTELADQIKARIGQGYVYSLSRSDSGLMKFSMLMEFHEARYTCAFEYRPNEKTLRLITFF